MIVDASVWIDHLRDGKSSSTVRLREAMRQRQLFCLIPAILQEVLQGAESADRLAAWVRVFDTFPCLAVENPARTAVAAATLYARCRWSGITPRGSNDCLIAVSCIELDQPLLHNDIDFDRIAKVEPRLRFTKAASRLQ